MARHLVAVGLTLAIAGCIGPDYDCDRAEAEVAVQEAAARALLASRDVASVKGLNDCDSGGGGYTVVYTVKGVAVEDVARQLAAAGWTRNAKPSSPLMMSGVFEGAALEATIRKRPPAAAITEVAFLHKR